MAFRQILVGCAVLGGCAAPSGPAEVRPGPNGETVHYYPQLPYGRVTYAHRYGADGRLIGIEQRLTEQNAAKIVRGQTSMEEVRDLLGPPWRPERYLEREAWTYPMWIEGDPNPKWFIVQMSRDGIVREAYLTDDPQFKQPDSPGQRP